MSGRRCPVGCGRFTRGAEVMCSACMNKVSHRTQSELRTAWRRFNHTFGRADLDFYNGVIRVAIREARLAMGAARDVIDTETL